MKRYYFLFALLAVMLLVACSVNGQPAQPNPGSPHSGHDDHADRIPIDFGEANYQVASSGNWSDPSIWHGGSLPTDGAIIHIPMGKVLTVDKVILERFKSIHIDGTLRFASNVNTQLNVDTLISRHHGRLEIGTELEPISPDVSAQIIFADLGAIDKRKDPKQLGRGAILGGKTIIFGAEKTHRITLASYPLAGTTTLQLSSPPTGWKVADEIIITGTQGATSEEVRTIAAINGSSVTLSKALELDHVPPKDDLNLWVANMTRNVQFESENDDLNRRGHIMFHHTLDVNIQNAAFLGLGRTDKTRPLDDFSYDLPDVVGNAGPSPIHFTVIEGPGTNIRGRYAIHFHRGGNSPDTKAALIKGSVVADVPGWGFVNHSSNVDMINNVSYRAQGAGFYTEVGDEIGSMVGNIAIRTVNRSFVLDDEGAIDPDLGLDLGDFGNDGDGFWLSGNRVSVIDNVAAGASAHGIIFWVDGLIEPDKGRGTVRVADIANGKLITGRDTIPVWWAPLAEVKNNEVYGTTVGFRSRYIHSEQYMGEERDNSEFHATPSQAYVDTLNPVIDGVTVWDSRDGVLLNYNERLSLKNARLIGVAAPFDHNLGLTAATGVGLDYNNPVTLGPAVIENVQIEGYEMGFLAPRNAEWSIKNLDLRNVTDMLVHEALRKPRSMTMSNIHFGGLAGTAVAGRDADRRNIVLAPYSEISEIDPYYLLWTDTITLDGRQIYFDEQRADFIPYRSGAWDYEEPSNEDFGEDDDDERDQEDGDDDEEAEDDGEFGDLDPAYIGKTNQELMDMFGRAFAGEMLPASAVNDPSIMNGKIDP